MTYTITDQDKALLRSFLVSLAKDPNDMATLGAMADWGEERGLWSGRVDVVRDARKLAPPSNDELASWNPHQIATWYGIGYSGDMNPLQHGGMFYSTRDWESWGYANVVEFWWDADIGKLVVQCGTTNKLDGERLESAFRCCGIEQSEHSNPHAQIEACRSYAGVEPDDYSSPKRFGLDKTDGADIWGAVREWIEALAD
jgi:hypothetical protein